MKKILILTALFISFLYSFGNAQTWTNEKVLSELKEREYEAKGYYTNADIRGLNKVHENELRTNNVDNNKSVKHYLIRNGGLHSNKRAGVKISPKTEAPKIDILPANTSNDTRLSHCIATIRKTKEYRTEAEWSKGNMSAKLHDIYYKKLDECMEADRNRREAKEEKPYNSYNDYVKRLLNEPGTEL